MCSVVEQVPSRHKALALTPATSTTAKEQVQNIDKS